MVYLDYNATTPLAPGALEAMLPFFREGFGNPSSIHRAGREARAAVDMARDRMAALLGVKAGEIIFTGGGTESDNLAILGLARASAERGKHLITCATEHHAVLHACDYLERREGFEITRLPVDGEGRIDLDELRAAFRPQTTLVSLMTANNETGTRQPAREAAALCGERGVLFHTDAIQSFGKQPLSARDFDALSLAAHKFYGPKGVGLLYVRGGSALERVLLGGSHEGERRAGTENVAAIAGMAAAAEEVVERFLAEMPRLEKLREQLWEMVRAIFPDAVRNGSAEHVLANTLNVSLPGFDSEGLLMALDLAGVCVSSGSACMVGSVLPSHVLLAMGRSRELASAAVRFSLGRDSRPEDLDVVQSALEEIAARAAV